VDFRISFEVNTVPHMLGRRKLGWLGFMGWQTMTRTTGERRAIKTI
jgi:hypothetical protein